MGLARSYLKFPQAPPDGGSDGRRVQRFSQDAGEVVRIQIARVATGDNHDWNIARVGAASDFPADITASETRQIEIENDGRGWIDIEVPQRIDAVLDRDDGKSFKLQRGAIQRSQRGVVFDNQDRRGFRRKHTGIVETFPYAPKLSREVAHSRARQLEGTFGA